MQYKLSAALANVFAITFSIGLLAQDIYVPEKRLKGNPIKYPESARKEGLEGWVYYTFTVGNDGLPADIMIADTNHEYFAKAVTRMVKSYRFQPATLDGSPVETHFPMRMSTFMLRGRPQSASKRFYKKYRKALKYIEQQKLELAYEILGQISLHGTKNLYEELYFQTLSADYYGATGDEEQEMQHIDRVLYFARYEGDKYHLVDPTFYLPYLFHAYQFEVSRMMVGDALSSAQWMQQIAPDNGAVKQIVTHADTLRQQTRTQGFQIQGKILPPLYGGKTGSWYTPLVHKEIEASIPPGTTERILLRCSHGSRELENAPGKTWIVPQSWQDCAIDIMGKVGTVFTITELPRSNTAADR